MTPRLLRTTLVVLTIATGTGCTTFSRDGGFDTVSRTASERLGKDAVAPRTEEDRQIAETRTRTLLTKPLSMDDAVQIALLNNRGLQSSYAELGISEADLVQAARLPNPGFTFSRTHWDGGIGIARTFSMGVLGIFTIPLATRIERSRFEQTKLETADAMLTVAAEAQRAYIEAVAAQQSAAYAARVDDSAHAGAELASRMRDAGHFSRLDYAREQASYAEAAADAAKAQHEARAAREKLTRIMGLWGEQANFALPEQLPELPAQRPRMSDMESFAIENRLDIQAAKTRTASVAASLGLTKATRFVNALELGYLDNFESDKGRERGYEISIEIPLFDWGAAKVARAKAIYLRSASQLAQTAINARSEVRETYSACLTDYDIAKHYRDEVVPLRKTISEEMLLRYNGMLASPFELLADSREQIAAVTGYIEALKDYWLAQTDLQQALGGHLPSLAGSPQSPALPPVSAPQTAPIDHEGH